MTDMMSAALDLAAGGWAVLPLDGKTPTTGHTPNGHKDATTNRKRIRRWWADRNWNIGCPVPDSVMVFDIDPRNGGSLAELEHLAGVKLPRTLEVISGRRDGGRHLYFRRPFAHPYRGNIPRGIDVKTNGYMVVPPSLHPETGKRYRRVDRDIARLPQPVIDLMQPREISTDGTTAADPMALAAWIRTLGPGEKHNGLFWAASRAHEGGVSQHGLDLLIDAAEDIGISRSEARRVIASARKEQHA